MKTLEVFTKLHRGNVLVIASFDGNLVCELARAVDALPKRREVVTMSLAGSTSHRLDAEPNSAIAPNIEIGRDCLHRIVPWR